MRGRVSTGVACLVVIVGCAAAPARRVPVGPVPRHIPVLRNAAARGELVRIDLQHHVAEFRLSCGWYLRPKHKVRLKLWRVDLTSIRAFLWETKPGEPAAGHVVSVPLLTWQRWAAKFGWSGTLRLGADGSSISNGPSTDICAGVL